MKMGGHCYAIAGGKGGVGKTTTVVNIGHELASLGHDVVVVDADLAMTNLGAVLGVTHEPTVHDVLAGEASLEAAIDTSGDVAIVPGDASLDNYVAADPAGLGRMIKRLRTGFDAVLVDTGAGVSHETMVPCGVADGVVLVTTADDMAVEDTAKTADVVRTVDGNVLGVVVQRADTERATDVARRLGVDLLGTIPDAPDIIGDEPVVETAPESDVTAAYEGIASALSVAIQATDPGTSRVAADE